MPLDINIQLSDDDLQFFVKGMRDVEASIQGRDPEQIIAAARALLDKSSGTRVPPFIEERLASVESMIAMAKDVGFGLPDEDRHRVLAALAYLADPQDAIPDSVPVLGFLDDAIMIELCRQDLQYEIEAYDDFSKWRDHEASRHGEDPAKLMLKRVDWAEARRQQAIERMHRRQRESYVSGEWKPTLFSVR